MSDFDVCDLCGVRGDLEGHECKPFTDCNRTIDDFGKWFKQRRRHKNITLQTISKASGISIGNISDIENSKIIPTIKTASLIMAEIGHEFLICESEVPEALK